MIDSPELTPETAGRETQNFAAGKARSFSRRVGRVVLWVLGSVLGLVLLVVIAIWAIIATPAGQTKAIAYATDFVEKKTGTPVRIARLDIDFLKTIVLEGIYVEGQAKDTLLYAGELRVDIGLLSLGQQRVLVQGLSLRNATARVLKDDTGRFNFQYIIDAFASKKPKRQKDTTASPWVIDADEIGLENVRLLYDDKSSATLAKARIGSLAIKINKLGLAEKDVDVESIILANSSV